MLVNMQTHITMKLLSSGVGINRIEYRVGVLEISTICPIYQLIIFIIRSHYEIRKIYD